jgi:dipeptidyl-peptidase-3
MRLSAYLCFILIVSTAAVLGSGCSKEQPAEHERVYKLETIGPAQVVQLYADGFDQLTQKEKLFSYYLYLSSLAARDIAIDQHHPHALEVRDLMEELYTHSSGIDMDVRAAIERYLKLFWINNGFYDHLTSRKFVLGCTVDQFREALAAAEQRGAHFTGGENPDDFVKRLQPLLFDPAVDPMLTSKAPGTDWIRGSSVNFYGPGISLQEVERWAAQGKEHHPLNSRVVKDTTALREEVWRTGGNGSPPGLYSALLWKSISHIEQAIPFAASEQQAKVLKLLIRYYRTGDPEDFRQFNIEWVKDTSSVDFIHGFIEVYLDPRGMKGEFETLIYYTNPRQTALMRNLAAAAQYFEDREPWREEYKKTIDHSPIANIINVIVGTGGAGPVPPVGINLPNEQAIREEYGSKSVLLQNVQDAIDNSRGDDLLKEFAWDEDEIRNAHRYGTLAGNLHTAMHEVIGHGSGKVSPRLQGKDPADLLPGYYSTIEEARADLVAMWNAWDPKLVDIGVAGSREEVRKIGETLFQQRVRTALNQLRRIGRSEQIEDSHLRNRQLIVLWLIRHHAGVTVEKRNNKTYYRIVDFDSARAGVGRLLAEVMRIKAEGDLEAAKRLVETYAIPVDVTLRDEVQERVKHLNLPAYTAFVMPKLEPVSDPQAKIVDVRVTYPMDFARQMLEFSAFSKAFRTRMTP